MPRRYLLILGLGIVVVLLGVGVLVVGTGGSDGGSDQVDVLVATGPIAPGTDGATAVADGLVEVDTVSSDDREPGALADPAQLDGRTVTTAMAEGDQVLTTALDQAPLRTQTIEVPDGTEAVAVDVPFTAGGAGYVAPGDRVDVMALLDDGGAVPGASGSATVTVLQDVVVLDVSTEVAPRVASRSAGSGAATSTTVATASPSQLTYLLAVPTADVERLVQATGFHRLYVSLPADGAATTAPGVVGDAQLAGGGA